MAKSLAGLSVAQLAVVAITGDAGVRESVVRVLVRDYPGLVFDAAQELADERNARRIAEEIARADAGPVVPLPAVPAQLAIEALRLGYDDEHG